MADLKSLRERKGWTQSQLAQRLGVSDRTVSLWERGERQPNSQITLRKLRRVLGLTAQEMAELFKEEGNANK